MPSDYDDVTLAGSGIAKVPIRTPSPSDMRFTYAGTPHVSGPYIYVWPEDIEGVLSRYTHDAECATLLMRSGQKIPVCDLLLDVRTRLAEARRAAVADKHPKKEG
jgi:hypothetical protein